MKLQVPSHVKVQDAVNGILTVPECNQPQDISPRVSSKPIQYLHIMAKKIKLKVFYIIVNDKKNPVFDANERFPKT